KLDRARALRLEPGVMRDALARLDRERKGIRHLRRPLEQHVLRGQAVEGGVDLDRGKLAGVEAEHGVVLEIVGVERPLPLLERVPARAGKQPHDALRPFFCGLAGSSAAGAVARLALSASIRSMILPPASGAASAVMS